MITISLGNSDVVLPFLVAEDGDPYGQIRLYIPGECCSVVQASSKPGGHRSV